jgi:hypothetical protein
MRGVPRLVPSAGVAAEPGATRPCDIPEALTRQYSITDVPTTFPSLNFNSNNLAAESKVVLLLSYALHH